MPHFLTVGEVARRSGLTASALRYYDREGVLVPAEVDAETQYRRYAECQVPDARVVAHLRRVGMPLSELALVLDLRARGQVEDARDVVVAHETRLEKGLRDARREIAQSLELLSDGERESVGITVGAVALGEALRAVRFAAVTDRDAPLEVLSGVLVEIVPGGVRLVATDRYRLAVAHANARVEAGGAQTGDGWVLPPAWLDDVARTLSGEVTLQFGEGRCRVNTGGRVLESPYVAGEFPAYRRFLDVEEVAERIGYDGMPLVGVELAGDGRPVRLITVGGVVHVAKEHEPAAVHVNGDFLLQALEAAGGTPTLVLDGPIAPLAIRGADGGLSILMPVANP